VVNDLKSLEGMPEYLSIIKQGMHGVISEEDGGTAAGAFKGFPYVDNMGAKTGTAQVSKIDLENNAWFVSFVPFDDPQIVVVGFVPNGYKGVFASAMSKDIVSYFMQKISAPPDYDVPEPDSILP
jgi:penicillin-binding protein 2